MPQVTLVRKLKQRKNVRRAVWGGVVAAALVGVGVILSVRSEAQQYDQVIARAKQLDGAGNYAQETAVLAQYVQSNPPSQYRYPALVKLGDLELRQGKYALASGYFVQALRLRSAPEVHVVAGLAQASAKIGDKAHAIAYYKQAIALTPKSDYHQRALYQDELLPLENSR